MDIVEWLRYASVIYKRYGYIHRSKYMERAADDIERLRAALDHILKVNPSAENASYIMRAVAVNALQQKDSE